MQITYIEGQQVVVQQDVKTFNPTFSIKFESIGLIEVLKRVLTANLK